MSEQGWKGFLATQGGSDWVVLHGGAAAKRFDALVGRQQEQIAVLMKVDRIADFVGEAFEEPDRFD